MFSRIAPSRRQKVGDQLSIFISVGFVLRPAPAQWTVKAASYRTGTAFERERDFVELDEGHAHVDIANSHTHDHLSRHVQVRHHPSLRSASKEVDKPGLAWLAELPGAEIATCPALGASHRPSSNYYGKIARQRFLQIAIEAEKIECAKIALLFAKKEGDIRDQRRKLIQDRHCIVFTPKHLS